MSAGWVTEGGGVKVIAVVGSGSGSGKTTLICQILKRFPGMAAVKISPREDADARIEWGPGGDSGKDTARYFAAGAAKVGRSVGPRESFPEIWEMIRGELTTMRAVLIEGAAALSISEERMSIFVLSREGASMGKLERIHELSGEDLVIVVDNTHQNQVGGDKLDEQSRNVHSFPAIRCDLSQIDSPELNAIFNKVRDFLGAT